LDLLEGSGNTETVRTGTASTLAGWEPGAHGSGMLDPERLEQKKALDKKII
jgi:hypothetical protein